MRIFFNCLSILEGGQITRANNFISNLIWKQKEAKLIILTNENLANQLNHNKKFFKHEQIKVRFKDFLPFTNLQRIIWENIFLNKYIRESDSDIYISFSNYFPLIKPKVPSIIGVSNMAPFSKDAYKCSSSLDKLRLKFLKFSILNSSKKATKVFALSNTCKKELVKNGIHKSKITVIENGVEQFSRKKTNKSSQILITYISHFYNYKNHQILLKAFSIIPNHLRKDFKLILGGKFHDKSYVKKLLKLTEFLNISSNCKFINGLNKSELKDIYNKTDLFIFPSLIENCPNVLLEALSFGLPILCSNKMPMPEFGKDAVEYFDPYNEVELSKKIVSLLQNKEKLNTMETNSKKLSSTYSWDKFSSKILSLCNTCLKKC